MILKEIEERTSVRRYSDKEISENDIKEILEAGRIAPSWVNAQPWHFIAVKDNETKNLLAQLANGQKQVANAKYVIVIVADIKEWDEYKFKKVLTNQLGMSEDVSNAILKDETYYPKLRGENILLMRTIEQCSYAASFMTLQAQHLGISSCIIGAFGNKFTNFNLDIAKKVNEKLNIPNGAYIITMLSLGYKQENAKEVKRHRKNFDEVISKETYGNKF